MIFFYVTLVCILFISAWCLLLFFFYNFELSLFCYFSSLRTSSSVSPFSLTLCVGFCALDQIDTFLSLFFFNLILFLNLKHRISFAKHQNESATGIHVLPILNPPPSPHHPSGSSQCTSPKHPVLCIEPGLVTHFIHDITHVSMPVSQIFPPSPSPTESIRLFYTSVSLLLSRTQGYCYHLSKFHIYALVYCTGVFLSGLFHSV